VATGVTKYIDPRYDLDLTKYLVEADGNSKDGWTRLVFVIPFDLWPEFDRSLYDVYLYQEIGQNYRRLTVCKR
jgi:hypothetical protein